MATNDIDDPSALNHQQILPLRPFNLGMLTVTSHHVFDHFECAESCRSMMRLTYGLPHVEVFRWGGYYGIFDLGTPTPLHGPLLNISCSDGFEYLRYLWHLGGQCSNRQCIHRDRLNHLYSI